MNCYVPISLNYFLNCSFKPSKCPKKGICTNGGRLKTVREVVNYWKNEERRKEIEKHLRPGNQEYYLSIKHGFCKGVPDTGQGSKLDFNLTPALFEALEPMKDKEIKEYLEENPMPLEAYRVAHGTHRAYAMIGHLVSGRPYLPLYVEKDNLYCKKDCHWPHTHSTNPTLDVKYATTMDDLGFPRSEYTLCNSAILAAMGVRENGDLDVAITNKLRQEMFNGKSTGIDLEGGKISIIAKNSPKYQMFGCAGDDDLIKNYSVNLNGYNFCEPRFYFNRMHKNRITPHRTQKENRKIKEEGKKAVEKFNEEKDWQMYPFSNITMEQWGFDLIKEVVDLNW